MDSAKVSNLARWEMTKASAGEALAWLQSLPSMTQTNRAVAIVMAECFTAVGNWPGLRAMLEKQDWRATEFMRHAFLSRALRELELADSSKMEWGEALRSTGGDRERLSNLLGLATRWNWPSEGEETLRSIVNRFPDDQWARRALAQLLCVTGRTRSLMQLCRQGAKQEPADLSNENNLAMTALLLNAQEIKPHQLAQEVYQKSPTNAAYVSTYAFSLYLQGKNTEALNVMEKLDPRELSDPSIAGYYGVILKANGHARRAHTYLELASGGQLLPEEQKLFKEAGSGL
jgi:thioredoxin-like negative regulator of GroEL